MVIRCTVNSIQCSIYSVQRIVYSILRTPLIALLRLVYTVQCTMTIVHCTSYMYDVHYIPLHACMDMHVCTVQVYSDQYILTCVV